MPAKTLNETIRDAARLRSSIARREDEIATDYNRLYAMVAEAVDAGASPTELAKRLDVTRVRIYQMIEQHRGTFQRT